MQRYLSRPELVQHPVSRSGSSRSQVVKLIFKASASTSTVVTLTDILIDEGSVGFDLNSDGTVGDAIADITWQVPPVDTEIALNVPQVVQLTSGAYGLDI